MKDTDPINVHLPQLDAIMEATASNRNRSRRFHLWALPLFFVLVVLGLALFWLWVESQRMPLLH